MDKKIFLHIGLHKTATKYFQHYVFPILPKDKYLYNPEKLSQYLIDYLKADKKDKNEILEIFNKEKKELLKNNPHKKIVISREIMSGNLFAAYNTWEENTESLKNLFPEAHIIISLRYQPDWLLSCYRESLHEHHYQEKMGRC